MKPFEIFPFDALLLGLSWGEYRNHDLSEDGGVMGFCGFLTRRLSLFVPSFRVESRRRTWTGTVDHTFAWIRDDPDSVQEIGVSPAHPRCFFFRDNAEIEVVFISLSRSSFFDLLLSYLGDAMGLDPDLRFAYALAEQSELACDWPRVVGAFRDRSPLLGRLMAHGRDDLPCLDNRIREIVQYNECQTYFDVGYGFGDLAAGFDRDVRWLFLARGMYSDDEPPASVSGTSDVLIESLLKQPLISQQPAARALLATAAEWIPVFSVGEDTPDNVGGTDWTMMEAMRWLSQAQQAAWLAFSEVASVIKDADLIPRGRDASSPAPRSFRSLRTSGPDAILRAIARAEALLSSAAIEDLIPADVVGQLDGAVEGVVRRTWPEEFAAFSNRSEAAVSAVLKAKRDTKPRDSMEWRFASVAQTLYSNYRNPRSHHLDEFRCSLDEARMFVSGVRALLAMSEEIRSAIRTSF